jgi:polar amino acid transport system substrate-binding protein
MQLEAGKEKLPMPGERKPGAVVRLTTGEWAPYDGKDLPHYGCDAWLVSEAFEKMGIHVEFGFFPWARGLRLAEIGDWDGAMDWSDYPARREKFYVSSDYLSEQEWVFFYRADRPFDWHNLEDLEGKTIGVTSGYVYSEAFSELEHNPRVRIDEASTDVANLKKLLAGRIDVFPLERSVGIWILQSILTPDERVQIAIHPQPINQFKPHLVLSKVVPENEERMSQFDKGFALLKQSGRYAEIMAECLR